MIEMAKRKDGKPISLREIAKNQSISGKYLEQMASALKIAGLVESVRGAEGGYRLARPAEQITVWDIYCVLDIAGDPIDCTSPPCERMAFCSTRSVWREMADSITKILKSHTLDELSRVEIEYQKQSLKK